MTWKWYVPAFALLLIGRAAAQEPALPSSERGRLPRPELLAQALPPGPSGGRVTVVGPNHAYSTAGPFAAGAWWRDSEIAKRLELSEEQLSEIEQVYLGHRLTLVDLRAELEKQELRLQPLLNADRLDEARIVPQIDAITAARGRLEREHALMLLGIRRVLSLEQWRRLRAIEQEQSRLVGSPPLPGPAADRDYIAVFARGNAQEPFAVIEKPRGTAIGPGTAVQIDAFGLRVATIDVETAQAFLRRQAELDSDKSQRLPPGFKVYAHRSVVEVFYSEGARRYKLKFTDPSDARLGEPGGGSRGRR